MSWTREKCADFPKKEPYNHMAASETPISTLPDALMNEVENVARAERRSAGEVVQEAVERLMRIKRREKLYAFGESQTRRLGVQESDFPSLVHQVARRD